MAHRVEQDLTPVEHLLLEVTERPRDSGAQQRFTAALLESTVLVPGQDEDDGFAPLSVGGDDGRPAGAFFPPQAGGAPSSRAPMELALSQLGITKVRVAELPCREFWTTSIGHDTATTLNPLTPVAKPYAVTEMADLLRGVPQETVQRELADGETYHVTPPGQLPDGLLPRLSAYVEQLGGVRRATLAWMRRSDGLQGYLLVVVTDLPHERVVAGIPDIVPLLDGRTIDVLVDPVDSTHDHAPGVAPFYVGPRGR